MPASAHQEKVGSVSKCATAATYIPALLTSKSNVGQASANMANNNLLGFLFVTDHSGLDTLCSLFCDRLYPNRLREPIRYRFACLESPQFSAKRDNEYRVSPFAEPDPFGLRGLWNAWRVPRRTGVFANPRIAGRLMSLDHEGHRHERHRYRSPCREQ